MVEFNGINVLDDEKTVEDTKKLVCNIAFMAYTYAYTYKGEVRVKKSDAVTFITIRSDDDFLFQYLCA